MSANSFLDIGFDPLEEIVKGFKPLASLNGSLKMKDNPMMGQIINHNKMAANQSDFNHTAPTKLFKPEIKKPRFGM